MCEYRGHELLLFIMIFNKNDHAVNCGDLVNKSALILFLKISETDFDMIRKIAEIGSRIESCMSFRIIVEQ